MPGRRAAAALWTVLPCPVTLLVCQLFGLRQWEPRIELVVSRHDFRIFRSDRPILSGQNRAEVEHEPESYVQVGLLPSYNVSGGGGAPILEPLKLFGFSKSTTDDVPEDNRSDFRVFLASWANMNARVVLCSSHQLARWVLRVWL